ncbi:MAG: response regulator transcription factor [Chitinophagaceae bacterium]|nr:MAG: response regulator transcription factor [Chitinophagaceae bacterium]
MQVLIVEDELPAAERLQILLKEYDASIEIVGMLQSIEETVSYLTTRPHPDLVLLDISLADGCSFEIFKRVSFQKPVIFTTAYNHYTLEAFSVFSLHYIMKPVTLEALAKALQKYNSIANHFTPSDFSTAWPMLSRSSESNYKSRFLVKLGQKLIFVDTNKIHFFEADNKIVYLQDQEGNRYTIDHKLDKLEEILDPHKFFRVNRRYLVNIDAIQHIRPYLNNRLKLCVKGNQSKDDLIVSRERVSQFRSWAEN